MGPLQPQLPPPPSFPINTPPAGQLPTALPPHPPSQISGQQVIAPTVPAGLALPQGLPGPAPAINTRASSQSFADIKAEWNLAHETLSKSFQELAGIFGKIEFLLSQLEVHLEAAGMNSGLDDCVKAGKECVDGMNALNGGVAKFNTHYQNFKSNNVNSLNNLNQEGKSTLLSLENALLDATTIFKSINVGGAVPASAQATQPAAPTSTGAQATQSVQTLPTSQPLQSVQPLPPSQSNQAQIQQIQQYFQTSSTNLMRNLSDLDRQEQALKRPYDNGFTVDTERQGLLLGFNQASLALDQCEQIIQNALNNLQQSQQNNQPQAQQAWTQVKTAQTGDVLHLEKELDKMSGHIDRIDSFISSITKDLLEFSPHLANSTNSFKLFTADFSQKSTDFWNLSQQMQVSVLSQNDHQQLVQAQQNIQLLADSQNSASLRIQNLNTNYQTLQVSLASHMKNRDDLRLSHRALEARVKKIKDDLRNNP
jgi:hypothetical protein